MTHDNTPPDLFTALERLTSLHDGDAGASEIIRFGQDAVPLLHSVLLTRDTSGFFETRRRAVAALETLKAYRILREFLSSERWIADPIERTGEDAVVNAVARVLGRLGDPGDIPLLYSIAQERPRAGVIEALGAFHYEPALALFIDALADDFARSAAETAIQKLGVAARPALLACACLEPTKGTRETSASMNRRRSALRLLQDMPLSYAMLPSNFKHLITSNDAWIAIWATRIALKYFRKSSHKRILGTLVERLRSANELIAEEIEDVLVEYYNSAKPLIEQMATLPHQDVPAWRSNDYSAAVLQRVQKRATALPQMEWRHE